MPDYEMMNDEYFFTHVIKSTCSLFITKEKRTVIDPNVKKTLHHVRSTSNKNKLIHILNLFKFLLINCSFLQPWI